MGHQLLPTSDHRQEARSSQRPELTTRATSDQPGLPRRRARQGCLPVPAKSLRIWGDAGSPLNSGHLGQRPTLTLVVTADRHSNCPCPSSGGCPSDDDRLGVHVSAPDRPPSKVSGRAHVPRSGTRTLGPGRQREVIVFTIMTWNVENLFEPTPTQRALYEAKLDALAAVILA